MAKFCTECGNSVAEDAKFCGECGNRVEPTQAAPAAPPMRKERKFATALFVDVVGSTSLNEATDPEIVQIVIGQTFDRLREVVEDHGGFLEKFIGDAILAVFGIPRAREDDPERAVKAAMEMQALAVQIRADFEAQGKPGITLRIGLEAGEVLVDTQRVATEAHRMLTGDAVNTAARLEAAAEPDTVLVGPVVYSATKHAVAYEYIGDLELKGKAKPLPTWRATGKTRRQARWGVRADRLVGRDDELTALDTAMATVEATGETAAITVFGEAGVGKSRLLEGFYQQAKAAREGWTWRSGRCLAYGSGAYSGLAQAFKQHFGIFDTDSPAAAERKVRRRLDDETIMDAVLGLVGAADPPAVERETLFASWLTLLESVAAETPLLLVIEDLHWADEGMLDFLEHLHDNGRGPILLVALARPLLSERRAGWTDRGEVLTLGRLDVEATVELLEATFSPPTLPSDVISYAVRASSGNPLFAQEIVKMLIDRQTLVDQGDRWEVAEEIDESAMPNSVQSIMAARLDMLPPEQKVLIQDSSVVGQSFWSSLVASLGERERALTEALLTEAEQRGTLIERLTSIFEAEQEFAFHHEMLRDVAYEMLTKLDRVDKHRTTATWVGERAQEREDLTDLMATHLIHAARYLDDLGTLAHEPDVARFLTDTYQWCLRAAARAQDLWAPPKALEWYRECLWLVDKIDLEPIEVARLWERYADAGSGVSSLDETTDAYRRAGEMFSELEADFDHARVRVSQQYVTFRTGDSETVRQDMPTEIDGLARHGATPELVRAWHMLAIARLRLGDWSEGEDALLEAIRTADELGRPELALKSQQMHAIVMCEDPERWEAGVELFQSVRQRLEELHDLNQLLAVLNNLQVALLERVGDVDEAVSLNAQALELARRTGRQFERALNASMGTLLALTRGRVAEAWDLSVAAEAAARHVGEDGILIVVLLSRAQCAYLLGRVTEGNEVHDAALAVADEVVSPDEVVERAVTATLRARATGHPLDAVDALWDAVDKLEGQLQTTGAGRVPLELARLAARHPTAVDHDRVEDLLGLAAHQAAGAPAEAMSRWAVALLQEPSEEQAQQLLEVSADLERMGRRLDLARCLLDVARVRAALGQGGRVEARRAGELLESAQVTLWQPEVDEALEAAGTRP